MTAGNTKGVWAFGVPVGGEWTITITSDTNTNSKTVTIGEAEIQLLEIDYRFYLFVENGGYASKWKSGGNAGASITNARIQCTATAGYGGTNMSRAYYSSQIDLAPYSKLCAEVSGRTGGTLYVWSSGVSSAYATSVASKSNPSTSRNVITLDISNINVERYVGIEDSQKKAVTVYNVWLE